MIQFQKDVFPYHAHWMLQEAGSIEVWDGLTSLFVELVNADETLLKDAYIEKWYKLSK